MHVCMSSGCDSNPLKHEDLESCFLKEDFKAVARCRYAQKEDLCFCFA